MSLTRRTGMRWKLASWAIVGLVIFGCSGGDERPVATVSGLVTDTDGNPVRNARVWWTDNETVQTYSNSAGTFVLDQVREGTMKLRAEVFVQGLSYYGENLIDTFGNYRSKSLNIVVGRRSELASMSGYVSDRDGNRIQNSRIYANVNGLGSTMAITDKDGHYSMPALHPGLTYEVYATGLGYNSDSTSYVYSASTDRRADWVLSNPTDTLLSPPTNFSAVSWTSPAVETEKSRGVKVARAKDALQSFLERRKFGHERPHVQTVSRGRDSVRGNWIEVDLYWDPIRSEDHIGYGVYRGTSANGATQQIEYIRDTLTSFFADADQDLLENRNYYYEMTTLNTNFPDTYNSESDFSDRYGVLTLGDLSLRAPTLSPLTFRWNAATGAQEYTVFIFDDVPNYGVQPLWPDSNNQAEFDAATTTSTSLVYAGPGLVQGRTYYYVVLGHANNLDSRTISIVGSFTAN